MVSVDYATLYQIIRQSLYTGIFYARIAASRSRQEGEVELYIQNGEILTCFFTNTQGQKFKRDDWETLLPPLGVLDWESKTVPTPEPLPVPPPGVPYQEVVLTQVQLSQLPISCRSVYFLVNGSRAIEDIALTLGRSPQEIVQVIEYLSRLGVVRLR